MDKLRAMQVFVEVVDNESLTITARKLKLSVGMVSNYLKYIEDELGVTLLVRTTRKMSITEFGSYYYKIYHNVLDMLHESEKVASYFVDNPEGILNVSIPRSFGIFGFLPALKKFYSIHPKIRVNVSLNDALVDLSESRFDAVVRLGTLSDSSLIARPLKPYKLVLCAAPEYLSQKGNPTTPQELIAHDFIATYFDEHKTTWNVLQNSWEFLKNDAEFIKVSVLAKMQINDAQGVSIMVLNGQGIALLPDVIVNRYIAEGQLIELLADYKIPTRKMHLLYRKSSHIPLKLKVFIEFIMAEFG